MENRIRRLRQAHRMSQVRLSIELEVSQETVSAYENGKHYPSYPLLVKMSDLFGVSIDYLMGREDDCEMQIRELNAEEAIMLRRYRSLDELRKAKVEAYIHGLSERI